MRASFRIVLAAVAASLAAVVAVADPPLRQLSDADVVAYAAQPFDKAAMMFQHVQLGLNHGLVVIADFPCSDLCPSYTVRIIHYDLGPGRACEAAGGVTLTRDVPEGIGDVEAQFCVPKALASH